jgi:ubiquinone/menaquinone biosynthesis C-methylase UbiE
MAKKRLIGLVGLLAGFFLLGTAALLAQQSGVLPGSAISADPDLEKWRSGLEYEGREVYNKRLEIVQAMKLKPGMTVADIGAGTGLFTRLFAKAVEPSGRVYAVDVSSASVDKLMKLAKSQGLDNVTGVVNGDKDVRLPPDSIDVVYLCDSYHHFDHPAEMLKSIMSSLKPGGKVVLVDFERIPGKSPKWILEHVKHNKEQVVQQFKDAGFAYQKEKRFMAQNYFVIFRRPQAVARPAQPRPAEDSSGPQSPQSPPSPESPASPQSLESPRSLAPGDGVSTVAP